MPRSRDLTDFCGDCGRSLDERGARGRIYPCPMDCGERFCSAVCVSFHMKGKCSRRDFYCPLFGERFSGPNYPLTKACALAGIAIQKPMDLRLEGDSWDLLTEEGKIELEEAECEPRLKATHWAPECRTFSRARGRWIQLPDGRWIRP